jgi:hypothetical protein
MFFELLLLLGCAATSLAKVQLLVRQISSANEYPFEEHAHMATRESRSPVAILAARLM